MATDAFITVNGAPCSNVKLTVPSIGPWVADVDMHDAPSDVVARAKVSLKIGAVTLIGTVRDSGYFADSRRIRVVAGADGWSQKIDAKGYHNDAYVKASTVISDAARACGETIGINATNRLGTHYTRDGVNAGACITDAAPDGLWWVGFDGVTNVGARPSTVATSEVTVTDWDGRHRQATIDVAEVNMVTPGMKIQSRMPEPQIIRSLEFTIDPDGLKCTAWCGTNGKVSSFGDALKAIVDKVIDERNFGLYRYRVRGMDGERVNLQAITDGSPDLNAVPIWPGNYGMHSRPDTGSEVVVAFAGGERGMPIIIGFSPGTGGQPIARSGDVVDVLLPPGVITGTLNGVTPFTGVITFPTAKTLGTITTGSGKGKQE